MEKKRKVNRKRGFSLVELMVGMGLATLVLGISTGSLLFLSKSTAGFGNYQQMNMTSRLALDTFASVARMTVDVNSVSDSGCSLEVYNATGGMDTVVYQFEANSGEFSRSVNGGAADVILENVEFLDLDYFNIKPTNNATTIPLEVKEIQLQATLRRNVLSVGNTNEIISARFMMRNRAVSNG